MLREFLVEHTADGEKYFRWRGGEITRLEGFSDAVFAFAITLLVVSLEVPRTFQQLALTMKGFAVFAICFTLLLMVWYEHFLYFRRYGFQSVYPVFLNAMLLFVVLFYVYPLKFLFTLVIAQFTGGAILESRQALDAMITNDQVRPLFAIYGAGFAGVYALLALLYLHAYGRRRELELNECETLRTRHEMINHIAYVAIGLTSIALAVSLPMKFVGLAGIWYSSIGVYSTFAGAYQGKREQLAWERSEAEAQRGSPTGR